MAQYDINSRTKPHLNVGTLGHRTCGKTSLALAISAVLAAEGKAKALTFADLDNTPEERAGGITIDTARVEYTTDKRHYAHTDCPGVSKYVKNMFTGAAQMDAAILVVTACDGLQLQSQEHVLLANQAGVSNFVCFVNKIDTVDSEEDAQPIVETVVEYLAAYGFPDVPVICGSASAAIEGRDEAIGKNAVLKLLDALDAIPEPVRALDKPFAMVVKDIFPIKDFGIKVIGRIDQGTVKAGDEVEFVGIKPAAIKAAVSGVESFKQALTQGQAGDNVELLIPGIKRDALERGQVACAPGSITPHRKFKCNIYVLAQQEGGRHTPFRTKYKPQFFFRTADVAGTITLPDDVEMVNPGENVVCTVELSCPVAMEPGQRFAMREANMTVGTGEVTEIIE